VSWAFWGFKIDVARNLLLRTLPDWLWGPSNHLYNGYWLPFPQVKQPGHIFTTHSHKTPWARTVQSAQRIATGWTDQGLNPVGGEIFHTCADRPWGPPSLLYNGYRVFPGCKEWPGCDADPSPPSSATVKE